MMVCTEAVFRTYQQQMEGKDPQVLLEAMFWASMMPAHMLPDKIEDLPTRAEGELMRGAGRASG